ncbi:cytochrome P450 [Actinoplanes missouriensis]|uniref:cytochrome P450 n=1 Tax=Actinoplanes missouriensis TaxID=1866 RepID=UPI003411D203
MRTPLGDVMWLVRDYTLGRRVLTDSRFSRAAAARPGAPQLSSSGPAPTSIMSLDGSDHARLRRIVAMAFTTGRMARLRPFVEQTATDLLTTLAQKGSPADLITGYASPLPATVLGVLLGVPPADRPLFESSVEVVFDLTAGTDDEKARHQLRLVDYMVSLVTQKQSDPGDDLMTMLVGAHQQGQLSKAELVSLGLALLTAGYETTAGQLGLSVLALLRTGEPGRYAADPARLEGIVEELMRLSPATPVSFPRVATEDVDLGPVTVAAGEAVLVSFLEGNRDESIYPEPATVLAGRQAPHLTFGHGVHRCLGAPLARLQLRTALELLFRRFPDLRLAPGDDAVVFKSGLLTRGLARLAVTW